MRQKLIIGGKAVRMIVSEVFEVFTSQTTSTSLVGPLFSKFFPVAYTRPMMLFLFSPWVYAHLMGGVRDIWLLIILLISRRKHFPGESKKATWIKVGVGYLVKPPGRGNSKTFES